MSHGTNTGPHAFAGASADELRLLDSLDAIVWEGDPATFRFRYVSRQAERILGYSSEDWLAPGFWASHLHPDDVDWAVTLCEQATKAGQSHSFEYRMLAADGSVVWLRDAVSVELEDGRPVSMRGVMVDVSGQRRAEQAQRDLESRLRTVVSNAPVIVFALDSAGTITLCEGKGLEAIGLTPEELVGQSYLQQDAVIRENLRRALDGETFSRMVEFGGHTFETRYAAVDGADETAGVMGVATDITDRLTAERERERLEAQVQYAQKLESLGVLAGGIAHDFNNLLMSILGSVDLALEDVAADPATRSHLERARDAARRLSGLTHQMLDYSGQGACVLHSLDLSQQVRELDHLIETSVRPRGTIHYELAPDLPLIEADASQIGQVILNLVTNAADALDTAAGSVHVRTGVSQPDAEKLSLSYLRPLPVGASCVFLEVEDDGAGIDADLLDRIFDPFYTTKRAGRGLGLAVVLGIVRGHHGAMSVWSQPGAGSRFRILFPGLPSDATVTAPPARREIAWRGRGTVLLVDDEADLRELGAERLERFGLGVRTASDGREALEILRAQPDRIDLVLLDLTMPVMGGAETLEAMHRVRPDLPVILMSGYSEERSVEGGLSQAAGFLQKPFSGDDLIAIIRPILD